MKDPWEIPSSSFTNVNNEVGEKISGGTSGAISRTDIVRQDEHARKFYDAIRKRQDDVNKIAKNTGYNRAIILKVKQHMFLKKHNLGVPNLMYFDPDFDQSVSWQNLIEGKNIREMDLILLKHEIYEIELMEKNGWLYSEAHAVAEKKCNYRECYELLDKKGGKYESI